MAQPRGDPEKWSTPEEIAQLWDNIQNGVFQWGSANDKAGGIIKEYQQVFGRLPTTQEISAALPAARAGQGLSYINQAFQSERNSPEGINKRNQETYTKDKSNWDGQIGGFFQTSLGREATNAEKEHFGSLLASGQINQYGLTQFLQNLPEYTNKQDKDFQNTQRGELESADTKYYQDKLLPAIQAQMAGQGRSLESSGYASALAQAAKQQSQERERYLTGLSAAQYQGRTGQIRSDYESYINQLGQNQSRNQGLQDQLMSRQNEYSDYNLQRDAYNQYLSRYGKRKNQGYGQLAGGVIGGGLGAFFGGPVGAGAGYQIGSGLGGAAESQWG